MEWSNQWQLINFKVFSPLWEFLLSAKPANGCHLFRIDLSTYDNNKREKMPILLKRFVEKQQGHSIAHRHLCCFVPTQTMAHKVFLPFSHKYVIFGFKFCLKTNLKNVKYLFLKRWEIPSAAIPQNYDYLMYLRKYYAVNLAFVFDTKRKR